MPRRRVLHLNDPANDIGTVCGRKFDGKIEWTLEPAQVTCLACKRVMGTPVPFTTGADESEPYPYREP